MVQFCVLLPHLTNEKGHHYAYNRSVQQAVESVGYPFKAYISERCIIGSLPSQWEKVFPKKQGVLSRYYNLFFRLFRYCIIFRKKTNPRIFFMEDFGNLELTLLSISAIFFLKRTDTLWILHRFSLDQYPFQGRIILFCSFLLRKILRTRYIELTDSDLIQQSFQRENHIKTILMPIPHASSHSYEKWEEKSSLIFWWPGEPRPVKGLKEIQKLVSLIEREAPHLKLVVSESAPLKTDAVSPPFLQRIPPILTRKEYESWMLKSDVILLPYHGSYYRMNTSGILVEAVVAGKIPFVSPGSWLAHELKKYQLEELILDWSQSTILQDIQNILRSQTVLNKLLIMKNDYEKFHSIQNYSKILKSIICHE